VYSSSPDRGLAEAVRAWPEVRKRVPDAELHCFYGFENWERSLQLGGENGIPHCSRAALDELKQLIATTEGVFMHGRVNGKRLAEEMLASGVWFYPTWFSETSCITAMEAQVAGLRCVCPAGAALGETVPDNRRCWDGDVVENVSRAMITAEHVQPKLKLDFSLDTLATDWDKRLRSLVDAVVPAFSEAAQ
jgi:glycosyltransferase involved in cell wall biosynthesis